MPFRTATGLLAVSGLLIAAHAAPALADGEPAPRGGLVPLTKAGVLYINMTTGERSLTLYNLAEPEIIDAHHTAALFDYWMSIDENPCWDDPQAKGFGFNADNTEDLINGITAPVAGFDFGDLPFDSQIAGILIGTAVLATESTDSNADGTLDSGIDTVSVYYDGLSEANASSTAPPTAVVRIESIPGNRGITPDGFDDYDLILDFGAEHFELGDSDGQGRGALWIPGANLGADVQGSFYRQGLSVVNPLDGLADFQYLQYYAQHGTNDKVTAASTFVLLGAPEGTVSFITYTYSGSCSGSVSTDCIYTVTETIFTPDAIPQGQGAFESIGIAALGTDGDTSNLDWSPGGENLGCCFWFGGLDCAGFLNGLDEDPPENSTWYGFSPYAQISLGLFTKIIIEPCLNLDFNADLVIDTGDIGAFVALFLSQDLAADMNSDGVTDNGDIGAFVNQFLACTG